MFSGLTDLSRKVVASLLLGTVLAMAGALVWTWLAKKQLEQTVKEKEYTITLLRADVDKAVDSSVSCKNAIEKLIRSNRKKHSVIKEYESQIQKGEVSSEINSVDDFISWANRLR
jgi:predicted negative regulator of RcsB-dependent stress response